jgi:hypothetical protein
MNQMTTCEVGKSEPIVEHVEKQIKKKDDKLSKVMKEKRFESENQEPNSSFVSLGSRADESFSQVEEGGKLSSLIEEYRRENDRCSQRIQQL